MAASDTHRTTTRGLTLVEMLVAFVIVGLLATLLIQAMGMFTARYETVQRVYRASSLASLNQHWFATTVQGIIPYGVEAHRFTGDAASFQGLTLQPLNADPATPVTARWSIEEGRVSYTETDIPGETVAPWTVLDTDDGSLAFEYADALGNWHDRWPVPDTGAATPPVATGPITAPPWTPHLVRLKSATEGTLWIARVEPSPVPIVTEAMYRE